VSEFTTVDAFLKGLAEEKIIGCRCKACGRLMVPPRPVCPSCGSTDLEPHVFMDIGKVKASTVIYVPLTRFQQISPHSVGVVQLDEGESISGLILSDGKHLAPGTRVKARYLKEEGRVTLAFQPV
jgi:uncharacterized OB-fold protein